MALEEAITGMRDAVRDTLQRTGVLRFLDEKQLVSNRLETLQTADAYMLGRG